MKNNIHKGYGAIFGDIAGSIYELSPFQGNLADFKNLYEDKCHYTDDTIMTIASMSKLLYDTNYSLEYKWWGSHYYGDYYGRDFKKWIKTEKSGGNFSYGNGAAMRVSPIGYSFNTYEEIYAEAILSAASSHVHHEAIKGAMCMAGCIFKLNNHATKGEIYEYVTKNFYDLSESEDLIRFPKFKVSCQDTVPVAINLFLKMDDIETCVKYAICMHGDCDTIASMAAELFVAYDGKISSKIVSFVESKLDKQQLEILHQFSYG